MPSVHMHMSGECTIDMKHVVWAEGLLLMPCSQGSSTDLHHSDLWIYGVPRCWPLVVTRQGACTYAEHQTQHPELRASVQLVCSLLYRLMPSGPTELIAICDYACTHSEA